MQEIESKEGKTLAYLNLALDYDSGDKEQVARQLLDQIDPKAYEQAGITDFKFLHKVVEEWLAEESTKHISAYNFDVLRIQNNIKVAIQKCQNSLPFRPVNIFVFPTFRPFVIEKMQGVTGVEVEEVNSMFIYINPITTAWQEGLSATIAHEYNHLVAFAEHVKGDLLTSIVAEGWAEVFREEVIGGNTSRWASAVPYAELHQYLLELRPYLDSEQEELYSKVFFGSDDYPMWLGYSLGYYLVNQFRKKHSQLSWAELLTYSPKQVLQQVEKELNIIPT